MDTDHMRRVLAEKGMGWIEVPVSVRQPAEHGYFFVDSDPPQKCCKAGVYYYAQGRWIRDCGWDLWEPDISWPQCGMVIEAMQEKGWKGTIRWSNSVVIVTWTHPDGWYRSTHGTEICAVTMECLARALETTDG